ncbi:YdcF family protein [Kiritimatiella glycovorans]|uniref:DUF218 domain-containing protein n=1 Tax=Kiritimatiella glycovorans TaxID=1307763 RepID=A0A0G3EE84_9BACT|nr:ElyC/SanA/YdcF family protein [Kiritimatiella glycovorans]AKJ63727.1 hypothetical protein L21SP4_00447 [Kiritimatiella glycovorans]
MYVLKKAVSPFLDPLALGLLVLLAGLIGGWKTVRRGARIAAWTGWLMLAAAGTDPGAAFLLKPLEQAYPVFEPGRAGVSYVVVLGAGQSFYKNHPPTSVIHPEGVVRLTEGVRLCRELTDATLVLCGGETGPGPAEAEMMKRLAIDLGADPGRILLESESLDTDDQARRLAPMLGGERFALVTSARHLPRAVMLCRAQGLRPVPAPTAHITAGGGGLRWHGWVPSSGALQSSAAALHEYIGLAWETLCAQRLRRTPPRNP